jgi:DNA primase
VQQYSRDIVAEVLAATDIVEVIAPTLELKAAGAGRMKALCPFHHEKTPSFTVNRQRQIYHCFGCGKGGDAIRYLMEHDGLSFVEALRKLADRAGIRLPAMSEREHGEDQIRTQLFEFGKFAAARFRECLADPLRGSVGRKYVQSRKLNEKTVQRFGLGYAPEGWSMLLDAARERKFPDAVIDQSGLFKRGDNGHVYDFFRNRVMFPIKDIAGEVVAFGGRDLGDSPAKYINSPETRIYKKSRVLYGLHDARDAMRREQSALLVEGYFDLLRCFDAGIENVVATCGTALTPEQAALIRRYVPEVVIVYDGDRAGINAALKATGLLTAAGLHVRAMALPDNQDPDDYIKTAGADAFRVLLADAPDFVTFYARMSEARVATIEGRTEVAQEIFGILQGIDDELRLDEYVKRTGRELGLNEHACRRSFEEFRRKLTERPAPPPRPSDEPAAPPPIGHDDCTFLAALLDNDALLVRAKEALAGCNLEPTPLARVLDKIFLGRAALIHQEVDDEDARRLYTAAASLEVSPGGDLETLVDRRIVRLKKDALVTREAKLQEDLQEAERIKDFARTARLLGEKVDLRRKIEAMGAV